MFFSLILMVLQSIPAILAIAYDGPQATPVAHDVPCDLGWTPKPTSAVPFGVGVIDLKFRNIRRQQTTAERTCGYVSGLADQQLTCSPGYGCAFQSPYFGCCLADDSGNFESGCTTWTNCYDYSIATDCTGTCYSQNRVCSSTAPYCAVFVLDLTTASYTHYDCLNDMEGTLTVLPSSQSPASVSTTVLGPAPTPFKDTASNHSHAGAIGGGVVGGVIFIALVCGGIFLYLRKRKQRQLATQMSEVQT